MFTISVCMIVKNESKVLSRILDCVKQFADEIIIVDTGSTDNTKEISRNYTDKVFDFEWIDDFSKARNFSFSKATCDYQMWLDADDYIDKENIKRICELKKTDEKKTDIYMCKYSIGYNENDEPYLTYHRERILKREANFKWTGFVHEVIIPNGEIKYTDIEIQHRKMEEHDPKRNIKLYQKAKKEGVVFSPRDMYYYARELYYNNHTSSAITNFKNFLKTKTIYPPDYIGASLMLCDCFMKQNQTNKAKQVLFDCINKNIPNAEICCKLGEIYDKLDEKQQAIFWYNAALGCEKQTQGFVRKDCEKIIPYISLTRLYWLVGNFENSKKFHLLAKDENPKHPSVIYNNQFF